MTGFRHLGERTVHQGHIWHVVVADFEAPDGSPFERDIVRSPGAVAVVPIVDPGDGAEPVVVLIEQYRPAHDRRIVEIPAGMRDVPGEATAVTAERELIEEVGLRPGRLELLTEMIPSAGLTDSVTTIYVAVDCTEAPRQPHGPEENDSRVFTMTLVEAEAAVERGEINEAKSALGILLAARWWRDRSGGDSGHAGVGAGAAAGAGEG